MMRSYNDSFESAILKGEVDELSQMISEMHTHPIQAYKEAIADNNLTTIAEYLELGVSAATIVDDEMNTALHVGVKNQNIELIKLSLKYTPTWGRKNKQQQSAIELALASRSWDCIQAIIEMTSLVTIRKSSEFEAVFIAAMKDNQIAIVEMLLKAEIPLQFFDRAEGEACFVHAVEHDRVYLLKLLTQIPSETIQRLTLKYIQLPDEVKEYFEDNLISFEEISQAMIGPLGITLDKKTIDTLTVDPILSDQPLNHDDFIPNLIVKDLMLYYKQPGIDITLIPPYLICPETQKQYQLPVVAWDGKTYENDWIIDYLANHDNVTPTGCRQPKEVGLYPNLLIRNLIQEKYPEITPPVPTPPVPAARPSVLSKFHLFAHYQTGHLTLPPLYLSPTKKF